MSKALSVDLRERVVQAVAEGASCRAAAARFGISASSAIRWCARLRATGSVVPGPLGGDRRSGRTEAHAARILELVARTPDLTLAELRAVLAETGIAVGMASLWSAIGAAIAAFTPQECANYFAAAGYDHDAA
jgi:transposase